MKTTRRYMYFLLSLIFIWILWLYLAETILLYNQKNELRVAKEINQLPTEDKHMGLRCRDHNTTCRNKLERDCKPLHFFHGQPQIKTALASYPGSGNTWTRHLLEQATGIFSGSVYNCSNMLKLGFVGENVQNGSVVVIKTHQNPLRVYFDQAIVLIRNPLDGFLSEFNRFFSHMNQTGVANPNLFHGSVWPKTVQWLSNGWNKFYTNWALFENEILVVHYESLRNDTRKELLNMLRFLNKTITEDQMSCVLENSEGNAKRKQRVGYDVYTEDLLKQVLHSTLSLHKELNSLPLHFRARPSVRTLTEIAYIYSKEIRFHLNGP